MRALILRLILLSSLWAPALGPPSLAHAQEPCRTWSEARSAGWIERFKLRPASEIKTRVEQRYKGQVINFLLCEEGGRILYKMVVFQPNGNVLFVTEPAQ